MCTNTLLPIIVEMKGQFSGNFLFSLADSGDWSQVISGFAARTFTLWAILLALKSIVDSCTVEGLKVLTIWKSACNLWFLLNLTTENRPAVIGRLTRNRNIKFNIFCLLYILYVVKQNPRELRWLFIATGNVPERRRAQVEAIASCSVLETSAHCSSSRRWLLHYHSSAVMP